MKKELPLVSAVITTYERPVRILERAVRSVLCQTYPNIELFAVNDDPENRDLAKEIRSFCAGLPDRVRYLENDRNRGVGYSRNRGLAEASGEWVGFLDDDDEWLPDKIRLQLEAGRKTGCDLIVGGILFYIHREYGVVERYRSPGLDRERSRDPFWLKHRVLIRNMVGPPALPLIRTEAIRACGGFRTDMKACEDWEMWMRLLLSGYKPESLDQPLIIYHAEGDSMSSHADNWMDGYDRIRRLYRKEYRKDKEAFHEFQLTIAMYLMRFREYRYSAGCIGRAFLARPFRRDNFKALYALIRKDPALFKRRRGILEINGEYEVKDIGSVHMLVPLGETAERIRAAVRLNGAGAFLWKTLAGKQPCTEADLTDALLQEYDVSKKTAAGDVKNFVQLLKNNGIISG